MEPGLDMSEGGKAWPECCPLGKADDEAEAEEAEEEECTLDGESQLASRSLGDLEW